MPLLLLPSMLLTQDVLHTSYWGISGCRLSFVRNSLSPDVCIKLCLLITKQVEVRNRQGSGFRVRPGGTHSWLMMSEWVHDWTHDWPFPRTPEASILRGWEEINKWEANTEEKLTSSSETNQSSSIFFSQLHASPLFDSQSIYSIRYCSRRLIQSFKNPVSIVINNRTTHINYQIYATIEIDTTTTNQQRNE